MQKVVIYEASVDLKWTVFGLKWLKMSQNEGWAMKMIEKELKIRNCLKNILIMDHIDTFDLMRVERAAEPISFNNFVFFVLFLSSSVPRLHFGVFLAILDQK